MNEDSPACLAFLANLNYCVCQTYFICELKSPEFHLLIISSKKRLDVSAD